MTAVAGALLAVLLWLVFRSSWLRKSQERWAEQERIRQHALRAAELRDRINALRERHLRRKKGG